VLAAGLNNTDINTRTGWYSKSVTGATNDDNITSDASDGTWDGNALTFPHIQGAELWPWAIAWILPVSASA